MTLVQCTSSHTGLSVCQVTYQWGALAGCYLGLVLCGLSVLAEQGGSAVAYISLAQLGLHLHLTSVAIHCNITTKATVTLQNSTLICDVIWEILAYGGTKVTGCDQRQHRMCRLIRA